MLYILRHLQVIVSTKGLYWQLTAWNVYIIRVSHCRSKMSFNFDANYWRYGRIVGSTLHGSNSAVWAWQHSWWLCPLYPTPSFCSYLQATRFRTLWEQAHSLPPLSFFLQTTPNPRFAASRKCSIASYPNSPFTVTRFSFYFYFNKFSY